MNIIHQAAVVSDFSDIEESKRGSLLKISSGTVIDSFVKIKFTGGTGDIFIGENCYINSGTVLYSGNGIMIGNNVLIASNCTLAATGHQYLDRRTTIRSQGFPESRGGIVVKNDVWIGANSVILDGSTIHEGAVVGANSLVKGELLAFGIYFGSPVKLQGFRK